MLVLTESEQHYIDVFKKNHGKMMILKTLIENAKKRGDIDKARSFRWEYTELKAELDAAYFACSRKLGK